MDEENRNNIRMSLWRKLSLYESLFSQHLSCYEGIKKRLHYTWTMPLNNTAVFKEWNKYLSCCQTDGGCTPDLSSSFPEQSAASTVPNHTALTGLNSVKKKAQKMRSAPLPEYCTSPLGCPHHGIPAPQKQACKWQEKNSAEVGLSQAKSKTRPRCPESAKRHCKLPTSYLGLLQNRCLITTPPPQLREQEEKGLQLDHCPWTTVVGFSSSRELHCPLEHH